MNKLRIFSLMLAFSLIVIAGCSKGGTEEGAGNNGSAGVVGGGAEGDAEESSEDYFEWDGNIIIGLTDSGAEQQHLVIPERCEGFNGMIFAEKENSVKSVSFESDKDIDLNRVFGSAKQLEYIQLPENISSISNLEFWLCESLKEISILASVTSIGAYAFQNNESLEAVTFEGNGVESIMKHAFEGCTALKEISIPDTVTLIDEYAFYECSSLETVTLSSGLKEVGDFAFANSGLKKLIVPEELELDRYTNTSFTQVDHAVVVVISEGSWMDNNFEAVFSGEVTKEVE